MYRNEDFFSPEKVDERLDLSLAQHDQEFSTRVQASDNPDLRLISDLRYLYGAEGTEHVRSLQRVWDHLLERRELVRSSSDAPSLGEQADLVPETREPESGASVLDARASRHLRLIRPDEELEFSIGPVVDLTEEAGRPVLRALPPSAPVSAPDVRQASQHNVPLAGRPLALIAAVLLLLVMSGSLLTIVRLTHGVLAARGVATATSSTTPAASTPGGNYPYPAPGRTLAISPSSTAFTALGWSPDSKYLATSAGGHVWLWTVGQNAYQPLNSLSMQSQGDSPLAWSPDGHLLAVGSNPIQLVDPFRDKVVGSISADYPQMPIAGQTTRVTALAWSPDGSSLAVASLRSGSAPWVFIWNMHQETGTYTFTSQGSNEAITSLSWSGDNRYVASSNARSVLAWEITNGYIIFHHSLHAATNVAWSPQGTYLAFMDQEQTQIWDVWQGVKQQGRLISQYPAANGVLSWSPHGQYLATASGSRVVLLSASNGAPIYTYTGAENYVSVLAWSPDGGSLASGEGGPGGALYHTRIWSA